MKEWIGKEREWTWEGGRLTGIGIVDVQCSGIDARGDRIDIKGGEVIGVGGDWWWVMSKWGLLKVDKWGIQDWREGPSHIWCDEWGRRALQWDRSGCLIGGEWRDPWGLDWKIPERVTLKGGDLRGFDLVGSTLTVDGWVSGRDLVWGRVRFGQHWSLSVWGLSGPVEVRWSGICHRMEIWGWESVGSEVRIEGWEDAVWLTPPMIWGGVLGGQVERWEGIGGEGTLWL
jgi:hypothetical protein